MFIGLENWVKTTPSNVLDGKTCNRCKEPKPRSAFWCHENTCKKCRVEQSKERQAKKKEQQNPDFFDPNTPAF